MLKLTLSNISKRYGNDWIFRRLSYNFSSDSSYALLGNNGSGKSTLLQIIAAYLSVSQGLRTYEWQQQPLSESQVATHLLWAAPYIELIEEFTLSELLKFHYQFKTLHPAIQNEQQWLDRVELTHAAHKPLSHFSSGMKQRVKLGLAFLSQGNLLLLDEPCTNLDDKGIAWYHSLILQYSNGRLLVVASNRSEEYDFCNYQIHMNHYK